MVVGCGGVSGGADVADDRARSHPSEVAVGDQVGVEDVPAVATDADLVAAEREYDPQA